MPTHAIRADKLVREYRDERGKEIGWLVRLAENLDVPREKAEDIIGDVIMYRLSVKEAEARLRSLARGRDGR